MAEFFEEIDVSNQAAYPVLANATWTFASREVALAVVAGADVVVSFDGANTAWRLRIGVTQSITFVRAGAQKLWLALAPGVVPVGAVIVQVGVEG